MDIMYHRDPLGDFNIHFALSAKEKEIMEEVQKKGLLRFELNYPPDSFDSDYRYTCLNGNVDFNQVEALLEGGLLQLQRNLTGTIVSPTSIGREYIKRGDIS